MTKTAILTLIGALFVTPGLLASPAWADAAAPVIDNVRVTVRDIHLKPGETAPVISHAGDYVVLYVTGGRIRSSENKTAAHAAGSAMAGHGGATADTALDAPIHEVVVELKDAPSNTVPNTTGLPPGFPRDGARKVFENGKVNVWNYTWLPGKPTVMHFHNTEIIVTYLGNGDIAATTPDGKRAVTHRNPGDIVFNTANRSHSEELVKGEMSGIMLELK
jgi:redox-sensitive bicupin YhaK (pirin superfamily)